MIKTSRILLLCFLFLNIFSALGQPGTINDDKTDGRLFRDLDGYKWKMKMMLPGEGVKAGLHELPPEDIETHVWNPARVPGDVYTDLWKAGAIDDPYFGRNSVRAQWVMQYEWWYSTKFKVNEDLTDQLVRLDFENVDYACEVWLNGHYLGAHEGAFSSFSFDINHAIRSSDNWLESSNLLMVKIAPPPKVNSKVAGRKTPWFGDYWRDLIPFGITGSVKMISTGKTRILDLYANTDIDDDRASVTYEIEVENTSGKPVLIDFSLDTQGKNFNSEPLNLSFSETIAPGKQLIKRTLDIPDPQLWWPWDLGKPNLYVSKLSLKESSKTHDTKEITFGIREVQMEWNPGFSKDEVSFPRTTVINGKPIFIRSACWGGPPDIFVGRTTPEKYKRLIALAKEMNMNNIRIFGWHPPEIPLFYELCNEAGITVWQDIIPLGTGNLPRDEDFLNLTIAEGVKVIKARRNHPSLIMMEGGEEMFLRSGDPKFTRDFLEKLGSELQKQVDLPYVPDSPLTDEASQKAGYKPKEAVHALRYFYGMGHLPMEEWYSSLDFPIVPELAITSVPSVESLKKFIPENEMWPPGPSWGHHWADLDRLRAQNFDTFGDEMTGSLEEFVNATQDAQGTIFKLSIEHFRRNKPHTSGIALCHFITYWPDMKWAIIDNYLKPKRSFNYVKTAYQPVLPSLQFDKRRWKNDESFKGELWLINDYYQKFESCKLNVKILNEDKNVLSEDSFDLSSIEENSSKKIANIDKKVLKKVTNHFHIELTLENKDGELISSNSYRLLIGDQKEAAARFKEMGQEIKDRNAEFSYGNYYRFFDQFTGENGQNYESQTDTIKTRGFKNN